jgi:uncharacterized membrane protein YqjE
MLHEAKMTHPYELRARSAKVLLRRLYRETSALVSEEAALAKIELAQRSTSVAGAARSFALALTCGIVGLTFVCAAVVAALGDFIGLFSAAVIIGVLLVIAAFMCAGAGRTALTQASAPFTSKVGLLTAPVDAVPPAERQERVEWTRRQVTETMAALEQKSDILAPLRDTILGLGALGLALGSIVRSGDVSNGGGRRGG